LYQLTHTAKLVISHGLPIASTSKQNGRFTILVTRQIASTSRFGYL